MGDQEQVTRSEISRKQSLHKEIILSQVIGILLPITIYILRYFYNCQYKDQIIKSCLTISLSPLVLNVLHGNFILEQYFNFTYQFKIHNPAPHLHANPSFQNQCKTFQQIGHSAIPKPLPTFRKSVWPSRRPSSLR